MSEVDEHHRNREEVHLIWTGPDVGNLPFRRTEQALLELVESSKQSLLIVAFAAYKIPELVEAINSVASTGINVECVFESHDASGGRVSFSPAKQLGLAPSVRTFVWPMAKRPKDELGRYGSLHAKCAVVDSSLLFLSSANLTEFAFNLNMELFYNAPVDSQPLLDRPVEAGATGIERIVLVGFAHELLTLAGHTPWTLVETAGRRASRRQPQRRESPLGGTHRAYIWANCRMGAITPSVFGSHVSMMAFANSRSRRSMNNPETACTRFWTGG